MLAILINLTLIQSSSTKPEDLFSRYRVLQTYHGKPVKPKLDDADKRAYRTRLRYAAQHGPKFAGHYRIAVWGCGAGCISFAVVDSASGIVTFFPATLASEGPAERLTFFPDSKALHIVADLNEKDFADRWYIFTGSQFKLIRKTAAQDIPDEVNKER